LAPLEEEAQRVLIDEIGLKEYYCRWAGNEELTIDERAQIQCEQGYYLAVLDILGPSGVILPLITSDSDASTATTFTTRGGSETLFTWVEAPDQFDSVPTFKEFVPVVRLNGKDESAASSDADYWSSGEGSEDEAFSVGAWVNLAEAADAIILSKYNLESPGKEWLFNLDGAGFLNLTLYDESLSSLVNKRGSLAISESAWAFLVATYRGDGSKDGITLYWDREVNETPSPMGEDRGTTTYVAMENTPAPVGVGVYGDANGFFNGRIAGGPVGPFFTNKELSAEEVDKLYTIGRSILGYSND
jgi:hypothetical protein